MRNTPPWALTEWLTEDPRRSVTICFSTADGCVAALATDPKTKRDFEQQGDSAEDALDSLTVAIATNNYKPKCLPPISRKLENFEVSILAWVIVLVTICLARPAYEEVSEFFNSGAVRQFAAGIACALCKGDADAKDP